MAITESQQHTKRLPLQLNNDNFAEIYTIKTIISHIAITLIISSLFTKQTYLGGKHIVYNSMTWINVWGTGEDGSWNVGEKFNINGIPSNFLYSPEGKLVAKNLRGDNIEKTLSEHIR